ncbi:hypothetical protein PoB_005156000 [Plakobranchus ocellatus]|uniref:Uncharacterized protein n=1 Tax=Plakobranchus ocellatus TaxID=259542 RepID=A0AAV4C0D5_9GAST|nr:hypothetical protein PoB_005156000 [Plakobranchus ocellatus]
MVKICLVCSKLQPDTRGRLLLSSVPDRPWTRSHRPFRFEMENSPCLDRLLLPMPRIQSFGKPIKRLRQKQALIHPCDIWLPRCHNVRQWPPIC